jgi:hypothetical protein
MQLISDKPSGMMHSSDSGGMAGHALTELGFLGKIALARIKTHPGR